MKFAKTIAIGASALGLAAGSALAAEDSASNDVFLLEPVEIVVHEIYGIDENRDGVIDGYLFLGESDTRA